MSNQVAVSTVKFRITTFFRRNEALAKNPENKDNKKNNKELDRILKLRTTEENKAHGEALKALRTKAKELIGKCTDIEKLEATIDILDQDTELEYKIED